MSSTSKPIIFVTGASGFVGYQIVYQLLEAGYTVRGAARGPKVELLRNAFAKYDKFEVVDVPDVSSADFTDAFKGVEAIIHTAAPLPGRADRETAFRSAVEGSVNILREADQANIRKVVVTGSMVTYPMGGPYGANDWNSGTKEQALTGDHWTVYFAQKKFGEQAVMEFADSHPHMDITLVNPPWVFGPFAPGFEHIVPKPDYKSFSTDGFIYALMRADNEHFPSSEGYVDVRDLARAHIAALNPISSVAGRKRFAIASPYPSDYRDALKYLADERPDLRDRLADPGKAPVWSSFKLDVELTALEDALDIKKDSYKTWRETILDTVDNLISLENGWRSKGFNVEVPKELP